MDRNKFLGYDWLMLHECYAKSGGSRWREFFLELGVLDFLSVKEKVITVAPTELVGDTTYGSHPYAPLYICDDISVENVVIQNI